MKHFPDSYTLFPEGRVVASRLIVECAEFAHLTSALLPCVLSQRALVERGRAMPGVVISPTSEGLSSSAKRNYADFLVAQHVAPVCDERDPDFILMFDVALWPAKDAEQAEHVVYHLLCHIEQREDHYGSPVFKDDGRPALRLRSHDIERFTTEIARYGSRIEGIKDERGIYAASRIRARALRIAG